MTPPTTDQRTGRRPLGSSLFVRIYATFVGSVLAFTAVFGLLMWLAVSSWNENAVAELVDHVEARGDPLLAAVHQGDREALTREVEALELELDADLVVFQHERGRHFRPAIPHREAKRGRHHPSLRDHPLSRNELRKLRHGRPVVHRRGLAPPVVAVPVFAGEAPPDSRPEPEPDGHAARAPRLVLVVVVEPRHNPAHGLAIAGVLLLVALGGGAWPLAHSLTSRLAKLERSTEALARGEFDHRAALDGAPRDEVDRLALSFNEMADRLEVLVTGQQTLLANVSHELRTPIARIKVLLEILGERLEQIRGADERGEPIDRPSIARVERGLDEMQEDLDEVESLIRDLLTSGRLALGRESSLSLETVDVAELCQTAAGRFDARVECEDDLALEGDRMLLDRLLRNLLANARRACPEGEIVVRGLRDGDERVIEVEDEGPGIPESERKQIFEPFARLDAARARDQGGVGLGLYLCRQVASAHGGTLHVESRRDGRSGALFILRV